MFNDIQLEYVKSLGQLETGRDNSKTIGKNNFFNIKDFSGKGPRAFDKAEGSNDAYLNFETPDDAYAHLYDLFKRKYPRALDATNINDFAKFLKEGGYATDPNYVQKLVSVHNSRTGQTAQTAQKIDLSKYQAQYGDAINAARAQGFTDARILDNIKQDEEYKSRQQAEQASRQNVAAKIDELRPKAEVEVAARLARNGDPIEGVAYLQTLPGYRDEIAWAKTQGFSNEDILNNLVPKALVGLNAFQKRQGSSFLNNVADGAVDQFKQYARGVNQFFTYDPDEIKRLSDEEAARRLDPSRVALNSTVGGQLGGIVPDLAVSAGTMLIPGAQGAAASALGRIGIGAATGGLTAGMRPVTKDESRLQNTITGATLGGIATGAVEAGIAASTRISSKVHNLLNKREIPLDQDIRARAIATKFSQDFNLPLNGTYIDTEFMNTARKKFSEQYDNILDNNHYMPTSKFRDIVEMTEDPNLTKHLTSDDLTDFGKLIYQPTEQKVAVSRQVLDAYGKPIMEPVRRIVRDAEGFPLKENYQVTRTINVPQTETIFKPKLEYVLSDPKMVKAQVIGPDGNVQMVNRLRHKIDDVTGEKLYSYPVIMNEDGSLMALKTKTMEQYSIPKTEFRQQPAQYVRTQMRDQPSGQIVMQPMQVKMRDADGAIVINQVEQVLDKTRTATEKKFRPKIEHVIETKMVDGARTVPLSLRDAHSILKTVNHKINSLAKDPSSDPMRLDALKKMSAALEQDLIDGSIIGKTSAIKKEEIASKLAEANAKWRELSFLDDVFAAASGDGTKIGNTTYWAAASKNSRYRKSFTKGESPSINILRSLQENDASNLSQRANLDSTAELGKLASQGLWMAGNPVAGAIAGVGALAARVAKTHREANTKGLEKMFENTKKLHTREKVIPIEQLKFIAQAAKQNLNTNVDRRGVETPVANERRSSVLRKTLSARNYRRYTQTAGAVVGGNSEQE